MSSHSTEGVVDHLFCHDIVDTTRRTKHRSRVTPEDALEHRRTLSLPWFVRQRIRRMGGSSLSDCSLLYRASCSRGKSWYVTRVVLKHTNTHQRRVSRRRPLTRRPKNKLLTCCGPYQPRKSGRTHMHKRRRSPKERSRG